MRIPVLFKSEFCKKKKKIMLTYGVRAYVFTFCVRNEDRPNECSQQVLHLNKIVNRDRRTFSKKTLSIVIDFLRIFFIAVEKNFSKTFRTSNNVSKAVVKIMHFLPFNRLVAPLTPRDICFVEYRKFRSKPHLLLLLLLHTA